jgi:integrase
MPHNTNHHTSVGTIVGIFKGNVMKTSLTDLFVKSLSKPGRYTDGDTKGLNLQVKADLKKYWVYRCTFDGKRVDLSFGSYPEISLKEARKRALDARNKVNQGIDPKPIKKSEVVAKERSDKPALTFKDFADSIVATKRAEWRNLKHGDQWAYTLETFAYPTIGHKALNEIDTEDILNILNPIWITKTETASRLRGRLDWILAAATTRKLRVGINPAAWKGHLQTILPAPGKIAKVVHHKAMPYRALPEFIARIRELNCPAALALEFLILNASRTGEVIKGLKVEVNGNTWKIPAERMKANVEHEVPLCERSLALLTLAESLDPGSSYLFSIKGKALSGMAMAMLLRRLNVPVTVHGFRSTFRDWVSEETDHPSEVAEMALAHAISNKVESAYRRGKLLERRRKLLLDWQSYCEVVHNNVFSMHNQRAA